MTPDKVEAALGVLRRLHADYTKALGIIAAHDGPINSQISEDSAEALSVLTEALAERERDAARYRWLRDPPVIHPLPVWIACPNQSPEHTVGPDWLTGESADTAIDAAMEETP